MIKGRRGIETSSQVMRLQIFLDLPSSCAVRPVPPEVRRYYLVKLSHCPFVCRQPIPFQDQ